MSETMSDCIQRQTTSEFIRRVEARVEAEMARQKIVCPACRYEFRHPDDFEGQGLITYHGEDPAVEVECPRCEAGLLVDEEVTRTYEVTLAD